MHTQSKFNISHIQIKKKMESLYDSHHTIYSANSLYHQNPAQLSLAAAYAASYMNNGNSDYVPGFNTASQASSVCNNNNNKNNSSNESQQDIKSTESSPKLDSSSSAASTNSSFSNTANKFSEPLTPPLSTPSSSSILATSQNELPMANNAEYMPPRFGAANSVPYQFLASPISHYHHTYNYLQSQSNHHAFNPYASAFNQTHDLASNATQSTVQASGYPQHFLNFANPPPEYTYFLNNTQTSTPTNLTDSKLTNSASSMSSNSSNSSVGSLNQIKSSINKNNTSTSPISCSTTNPSQRIPLNSHGMSKSSHQLPVATDRPRTFITPSLMSIEASQRRKRRQRTQFSKFQLNELEKLFLSTRYPDIYCREDLSARIGIPESRIQVWFKNRRSKIRKDERYVQYTNGEVYSHDGMGHNEDDDDSNLNDDEENGDDGNCF